MSEGHDESTVDLRMKVMQMSSYPRSTRRQSKQNLRVLRTRLQLRPLGDSELALLLKFLEKISFSKCNLIRFKTFVVDVRREFSKRF